MIVICLKCLKEFKTFPSRIKDGKDKYCSRKCRKTGYLTNCIKCNKQIYKYAYQEKIGEGKYCSRECSLKSLIVKCKNCCKTFIVELNIINNGGGKYCTLECYNISKKGMYLNIGFKKGTLPWNKGKKVPQITGKNNYNWKGGVTSINFKIRNSLEYKLWREAIFRRDNFTCQVCNQRGGKLNADHIKPFSLFPNLRLNSDNGRTLCKDCHMKTSTYGGKINSWRISNMI